MSYFPALTSIFCVDISVCECERGGLGFQKKWKSSFSSFPSHFFTPLNSSVKWKMWNLWLDWMGFCMLPSSTARRSFARLSQCELMRKVFFPPRLLIISNKKTPLASFMLSLNYSKFPFCVKRMRKRGREESILWL